MDILEQAEKLREKANVTFAEAKEALEAAGGDMLDALIYLENQGKATIPAGGGYFSSGATVQESEKGKNSQYREKKGESFWEMLKRFGRFCLKLIDKGNRNFLDAERNGEQVLSCPVTVAVVLLLCFFWVVLPLMIFSMFIGYRYRFRGAELGKESVNKVMDGATNVVEDIKKSFTEGDEKN